MNKDYIVKKSNYFIMNCSYDLSLEEQKLILTLSSMVQPNDEDFKPYKFRIADFIQLLEISTQTKYTEIPKITKELMKKVFEIEEDDTLIQIAWLSSATYKKGSGMVELEFSPKLKPYMLKLNTMFTQYKLANILSMKSKYSPRVYEILKCNEFKKQGYIEIEIDDLRKLLKSEKIYPKYNDFKRKIIIQTQKELKKISDISFEIEEIKTGRKVTALRFYIKSNCKSKNEIAATKNFDVPNKEISEEISDGVASDIKKVQELINEHDISNIEALKILKSSKGDFTTIEKVYDYALKQKIDNVIAYMIRMVKPGVFHEPQQNIKKLESNDYEQRAFDPTLEQKLLEASERELANKCL